MKIFKIEMIFHIHGIGIFNAVNSKKYLINFYNYALKNSNIIHLSHNLMENEIKINFDHIIKHYEIVNNGIGYQSNAKPKNKITRILFISNLFESKGILDILKIFKVLKDKYKYLSLNIAGASSGLDMDKKIVDMLENLEIKEDVKLHGFADHSLKEKLFNMSDIFVYPTKNDAFPLVLLESLSFGLPVISTEIGAIPEIIDHGITGKIINDDVNDFANNIAQLIENEIEFQAMSKKAIEVFNHRYKMSIFEDNFKEALQRIVSK